MLYYLLLIPAVLSTAWIYFCPRAELLVAAANPDRLLRGVSA